MDDEEETYRLWKIRKTIMQVREGDGGAWRGCAVRGGPVGAGAAWCGPSPLPPTTPPVVAVMAAGLTRGLSSAALSRSGLPGDPGRAGSDAGGVQGAVR